MGTRWLIGAAGVLCLLGGTALGQDEGGMFAPRKPKPTEPAAPTPGNAPAPAPIAKQAGGWSIVLASFRGDNQQAAATEMLTKVRTQKGLESAFVDVRGGGKATVVALGRFADPSSSEAQTKLTAVRGIEVEGKKPFSGSFLAPPGELTDLGDNSQYNLVRAKEQFGAGAVYTLQVGAYGRKDLIDAGKTPTEADLKDSRAAAESAVVQLRKEGELAFYYHGPRYSSVTIGVFGDRDFAKTGDASAGERSRSENPALTALRQRFPHNLYNGAGVKVKATGKESMQPSSIVRIPER